MNITFSLNTFLSIILSVATVVGSAMLYLHTTFIAKQDLELFANKIIKETRQEMLLTRDILIRNLERELLDIEFEIAARNKIYPKDPQEYRLGKKREIEILLKKLETKQ